jgi:hypothetical protein
MYGFRDVWVVMRGAIACQYMTVNLKKERYFFIAE